MCIRDRTIAGRPSENLKLKTLNFLRFHAFGLERVLGDFHQVSKRGGIGGGEVGEDLAVERDFRGLEAFNKTAVGDAGGAGGGVDAHLPEITEGAFLDATVAVGILPGMINGVGGVAVK